MFFNLQYENITIGYVESTTGNVSLHAGANQIPFFGELQKSSVPGSHKAILDVIQNFLTEQTSDVSAVAGSNCTSYPILANGMAGLSLGVEMPPFDKQLIASLSFGSMSLVPSTQAKSVILSASISISINSPLGANSPLSLTSMDMNADLVYQNKTVGSLEVLGSPVVQINATVYQTTFKDKLLILAGTGATYEKFAQDFIRASDANPIQFRVSGTASVTGSFALGGLAVSGIKVDNVVAIGGLDGLHDVTVDGISIDGEEGSAFRLSVKATIGNPGITTVRLEDFTLTMADSLTDTVMGRIPVDVLEIHPGNNTVQLHG